mmetsp:Transcript_21360/g.63209  ORF Transcript_21360/g.63209 Transcript_21360/m.63209 type:complete len:245 (+) Transcript_21360:149-883(+)
METRLAKPLSAPTSRGLRRLERVVQLAHPLGREPPARLELRRRLRQLALTPRPRRLAPLQRCSSRNRPRLGLVACRAQPDATRRLGSCRLSCRLPLFRRPLRCGCRRRRSLLCGLRTGRRCVARRQRLGRLGCLCAQRGARAGEGGFALGHGVDDALVCLLFDDHRGAHPARAVLLPRSLLLVRTRRSYRNLELGGCDSGQRGDGIGIGSAARGDDLARGGEAGGTCGVTPGGRSRWTCATGHA